MKRKDILAFLLIVAIFISFFLYIEPFNKINQRLQPPEYSVDEMYARHSFDREFGRFNFWDLVNKSDIDELRSRVKGDYRESEELFYRTGIYTWTLYFFYAWDVIGGNISCPKNMSEEGFNALIGNITPKYEELRKERAHYLEVFRKLEGEVREPRAYALLAWLELFLAVPPEDWRYDEYAREYGFSEGVCKSLMGMPEYYENYVFPYIDRGIKEVTKLNSESSGGEILSEKARAIIQNQGKSLYSKLVFINKTKQGSLEVYGAYGLVYYRLSKNVSARGFNALGLFYLSWAEGYYNISRDDVTKVPMRLDYPFNVSKSRDMVYSETAELLDLLHRNNFYTLDPPIAEGLLYHIGRVDYTVLPELRDRNSSMYFTYPSDVYTEYLHLLAKVRGIRLFYEHLMES